MRIAPIPPKHYVHHDGSLEGRKIAFLTYISQGYATGRALKTAGIPRAHLFRIRAEDPAFADAWDEINEAKIDQVEEGMISRAAHGHLEPVFYNGAIAGYKRVHNPVNAMFILRHRRSQVYGDKLVELFRRLEGIEAALAKRMSSAENQALTNQAALPAATPGPADNTIDVEFEELKSQAEDVLTQATEKGHL